MKPSYLGGFLFGALLISSLAAGAWVLVQRQVPPADDVSSKLLFTPEIVDEQATFIMPAEKRRVTMQLDNVSAEPVTVARLSFSYSHAEVMTALPQVMQPGDELPIELDVASAEGMRGPVRIRVDALGPDSSQERLGTGLLLVEFVQAVNAEPAIVTTGAVSRTAPRRQETVRLWHPVGAVRPPSYAVHSSDPAIQTSTRDIDVVESGRSYFCELTITIDPAVAGERFREAVTFSSSMSSLRIGVLGFVVDD